MGAFCEVHACSDVHRLQVPYLCLLPAWKPTGNVAISPSPNLSTGRRPRQVDTGQPETLGVIRALV